MGRAYSQDLRDRVLGAVADGLSARQAAARFDIGVATAIVWVGRERQTGERSARRQGQPKSCKLDGHADFLLGLIAKTPDITLHEMQVRLVQTTGMSAAIGTLWKFFNLRAITVKKNGSRG
jgi:transposase